MAWTHVIPRPVEEFIRDYLILLGVKRDMLDETYHLFFEMANTGPVRSTIIEFKDFANHPAIYERPIREVREELAYALRNTRCLSVQPSWQEISAALGCSSHTSAISAYRRWVNKGPKYSGRFALM